MGQAQSGAAHACRQAGRQAAFTSPVTPRRGTRFHSQGSCLRRARHWRRPYGLLLLLAVGAFRTGLLLLLLPPHLVPTLPPPPDPQPKRVENARILVANTAMDTDKIKIYGARVRVDSMAKVCWRGPRAQPSLAACLAASVSSVSW